MERGLLWLPLLGLFIGLAWAGWREYQKVEAYRLWSEQFDRAKYDIYAVLGQKGAELTWGKPTRTGMIDLQTFSLTQVREIRLQVGCQTVDIVPDADDRIKTLKGKAALEFIRQDSDTATQVPFTDASLALQWGTFLQNEQQRFQASAI